MTSNKGYSVCLASVFITSFMAGMGVLALPHALAGTGWYGIFLFTLICMNTWYSSLLLGRMWIIMEERWEEYRGKFRYPYPAMGERAAGPWMRYIVTVCLHITLIGIAVVYILISAQTVQSMTQKLLPLDYGYWIIILAAVLCPLSWYGSIEEFWLAAVGALATAALACVSIFTSMLLQIHEMEDVLYENPSFSSASLAFGTMLFSFSAAYLFPTVQNDMENKKQFCKATIISFIGIISLYLPVTLSGYAVLGSKVPVNILLAIDKGYLRTFIEACLAGHIFLAFLLAINPIAQEIEEAFNVKPAFGCKRCMIRSAIVGVTLLIAYTIPHFDKILNLIGGSSMTFLTFVFPPLFFLLLNKSSPATCKREIPIPEKVFLYQVMITGCAGAMTCTYFAVQDIINVFIGDAEVKPIVNANVTI